MNRSAEFPSNSAKANKINKTDIVYSINFIARQILLFREYL